MAFSSREVSTELEGGFGGMNSKKGQFRCAKSYVKESNQLHWTGHDSSTI